MVNSVIVRFEKIQLKRLCMKISKSTLLCSLLVVSNLSAIENIDVSGSAQLFYHTDDGNKKDLFKQSNSAADAGLNISAKADLIKGISAGVSATALSTLGLENDFISKSWGSSHTYKTDGSGNVDRFNNTAWVSEAWLMGTLDKTVLKGGRMKLDTPLAFTETWSIEKNSFDSVMVSNENIKDTTLVGAYIGAGNGSETYGRNRSDTAFAVGGVLNRSGKFSTFGTDGAFTAGALNNSYEPLKLQVWYYDVFNLAKSYWLQADLTIDNIMLGAQYSAIKLDTFGSKEDSVYALMAGYKIKDVVSAKLSYSSTSKNGSLGYAGRNLATNSGLSKIYTEAWWTYGRTTASDTKSINLTIEGSASDIFNYALYTTLTNDGSVANKDMKEITAIISKSFNKFDTSLVYTNTDFKDLSAINTLQAYLTLNF